MEVLALKLKDSIDVAAFLDTAKECVGSVFFQTTEGDILNLKSLLSQYVLVTIMGNHSLLKDARVICVQEDDYEKLKEYLAPSERP